MAIRRVSVLLGCSRRISSGGRHLLTPPSFCFDKLEPCVYTEGEVRGEM